jgi:hypothetical protein
MHRLSGILIVSLAGAAFASPDSAYELSFRSGRYAELAPGFVQRYDHPCGEVVTLRVASLQSAADTTHRADRVMELDAQGRMMREWPLPVDYVPRAVNGVELLIVFGQRAFWVSPEGNLRPDSLKDRLPEARPEECRRAGADGPLQCALFTDVGTGAPRRIGYPAACR